jgi:hypothetical protein
MMMNGGDLGKAITKGWNFRKQPLAQPQRIYPLSALCEFPHRKFCECSEWQVRRAAPQHADQRVNGCNGPVVS